MHTIPELRRLVKRYYTFSFVIIFCHSLSFVISLFDGTKKTGSKIHNLTLRPMKTYKDIRRFAAALYHPLKIWW